MEGPGGGAGAAASAGNGSEWVRLNVGGTVFSTTRGTLCVDKGSMLAKMFAPASAFVSSARDESGAYLLDRDPAYFRPLLNFLRTGRLLIDAGVSREGVLVEAEFFQVAALIERLQPALCPDLSREGVVQRLGSPASPLHHFARVRLCGVDLSGLALASVSFHKAALQGAAFVHSCLKQAVFTKALAERAAFSHAQLGAAALKFAVMPRCSFAWAKARNANFSGADLSGSDFARAQLQGALFQKACLRGCSFRGANLEHAKLQEADLRGADLSGAVLAECHLTDADLRGAVIDWPSVATGHTRMYLKGAAVTPAQQGEIPEELRARLDIFVLPTAPLPADALAALPLARRVLEEAARAPVVVFTRGTMQDAVNDRFHRRLLSILESTGTPFLCRNAFDDSMDIALAQMTAKLFLPKVFVNGRFVEVFSERWSAHRPKHALREVIEAALLVPLAPLPAPPAAGNSAPAAAPSATQTTAPAPQQPSQSM